jgi:hypothetical protein
MWVPAMRLTGLRRTVISMTRTTLIPAQNKQQEVHVMNRLSFDTTAPRRLMGKRTVRPRLEKGIVEAEAELIRIVLAKPQRITPF